MDVPNSASLGAMGSLSEKLKLLDTEDGPAGFRQLRDGVGSISTKLVKLSEVHDPPLTVNYWMKDARELSYDMEDCADQFVHADSDSKMDLVDQFKTRVEDVRERYDRFNLEYVLSHSNVTNTVTSHRLRTVYGEKPTPVGMEGPTHDLLRLLKPKADDENELQLKVVSILGVEGIGKSTLAQELWRKLEGEFECRAFVQTAKKPDMRMILRSLLLQVRQLQQPQEEKEEPPEACKVPNLIHDIRKHLQDKRYFIIIDDLCSVSAWDVVSRAFPEGNCCSRIITTTTIEDVGLACCSYDPEHIFRMEPLRDDHSKELFIRTVFGSGKECPQQFLGISDEITRKCGGLPLAIICIATLVSRQPETEKQWESVQNFLRHNLRTSTFAEVLKQVLKLCYSSLTHCVKTCLLYLSIYPENYIIPKEAVVKQWIAEGFICITEGKDILEVGRSYFDELVSLGLIQQIDSKSKKKRLSYAVHPVVFDFITCKSIEDNFMTIIDYSQSTVALTEKIRRLSLHFGSATCATTPECIELSQVRSLTFMGLLGCTPSLGRFKLVRVVILHLRGDDGDMRFSLKKVCELLLLRYLQVRCNVTVELPDQMQGLKQLETLEINAGVENVPSDIVHHSRLQHVRIGRKTKNKPLALGDTAIFPDVSSNSREPSRNFQVFELLPPICSFSRLPRWTKRLRGLRILEIVVRELLAYNVLFLAGLPALTDLSLYVRKASAGSVARRVTFCEGAFPALEYFKLVRGVMLLSFQEKAVPNLRRLKIGFNVHKGEEYGNMLDGIQHLINLQEVAASIGVTTGAEESDMIAAESAIHIAFRKHTFLPKVKRVGPIDEDCDPPKIQNRSQETESSNKRDEVLNKHSETQMEDSSIEQSRNLGKLITEDSTCTPLEDLLWDDIGNPLRLKLSLLRTITNNFSEQQVIGRGAFGVVYKGKLGDDFVVVKKFHSFHAMDDEAFQSEVNCLMRIKHQNIERFVGYCAESSVVDIRLEGNKNPLVKSKEKLLCFEYLSNGSLDMHLNDEPCGLTWRTCYQIIKGICLGLHYLHDRHIIHRDLKPAIILLDDGMVPKIADFGLSRLLGEGKSHTMTQTKRGTMGYMAPEYIDDRKITVKSDIYSLGVIIRKMVIGRKAGANTENVLQGWMRRLKLDSSQMRQTPLEISYRQIEACIKIAESCTATEPEKRPATRDILRRLEETEARGSSVITPNPAVEAKIRYLKLMADMRAMALSQQSSTRGEGSQALLPAPSLPALLPKGPRDTKPDKSFWLDSTIGAKSYMLSSRSLRITWGETPGHWKWISLPDSRFSECAELLNVYFLAVIGEIPTEDLSAGTSYAVYLVYKLASGAAGLKGGQKSSIRLYGERIVATSRVNVDPAAVQAAGVAFPVTRSDGWMEVKLAEFAADEQMLNEKAVIVDFREENDHIKKSGIIIEGMEFRPSN